MLGYRATIYDFPQNLHLRLKRTLVRLGPTPVAMQVTVLFNFLIVQVPCGDYLTVQTTPYPAPCSYISLF